MRYLSIILLVGLVACQKAPEQSTTAGEYRVERLFTHDGCTLYRFLDDRTVYYSNCNGSVQNEQQCGKTTCTYSTQTSKEQ